MKVIFAFCLSFLVLSAWAAPSKKKEPAQKAPVPLECYCECFEDGVAPSETPGISLSGVDEDSRSFESFSASDPASCPKHLGNACEKTEGPKAHKGAAHFRECSLKDNGGDASIKGRITDIWCESETYTCADILIRQNMSRSPFVATPRDPQCTVVHIPGKTDTVPPKNCPPRTAKKSR